jgi:hypothetical protein
MRIPDNLIDPKFVASLIETDPSMTNWGCYEFVREEYSFDNGMGKAHYHNYSGSGLFLCNMFAVCDELLEKDSAFYTPFLLTADCIELRKYVKEKVDNAQ